jgi:hypothetical protein
MKVHAHQAGAVLCGQANGRNIPLEAFRKTDKPRCKRCERALAGLISKAFAKAFA